MTQQTARARSQSADPDVNGAANRSTLTSGDLARMLHVDLKTIHNWVNRRHIFGRRTKGRHLRFDRTEVVRFMRRFGFEIPAQVGATSPQVLAECSASTKSMLRGVPHRATEGLFDLVIEAATGHYDVVIIDLDRYSPGLVGNLVTVLRQRHHTRGIGLVGVSSKAGRRRFFVSKGGDAAVSMGSAADLNATLAYLTGRPPSRARIRQATSSQPARAPNRRRSARTRH